MRLYTNACRENMEYKVRTYEKLQADAEAEAERELAVIDIKVPLLKRLARVEGEGDNWHIFESVSERFREAQGKTATFRALHMRAQMRLDELKDERTVYQRCKSMIAALESLDAFHMHAHIVDNVVCQVSAFLKDTRLFRSRMLNYMLVGASGTGKTSLASAIGDVFAHAGIFVGNQLVVAGRAELVASYEGQTVARTRNFLTSNLDNGVIFIDEAYGITPWQQGRAEGYGSEAATAMVEFMTKYCGLYCIIVAGYETPMRRYFLTTNDGMSRRFPHKLALTDMGPEDLLLVFKRALLRAQGLTVPASRTSPLDSDAYFTREAWAYLSRLVYECTRGDVSYVDEFDPATQHMYRNVRVFRPRYTCLYSLFEHQAGSMANLAEDAVLILMQTLPYPDNNNKQRVGFQRQPLSVMRAAVVQRIHKVALSDSERYLAELEEIDGAVRTRRQRKCTETLKQQG